MRRPMCPKRMHKQQGARSLDTMESQPRRFTQTGDGVGFILPAITNLSK